MALTTVFVESFDHRQIDVEPVDASGLPLDEEFFRDAVPVVLEHQHGDIDEHLASPGINHGRSYEVSKAGHDGIKKPWRDQYGNVYTSLVTKGNNFSRAEMMRSGTAPSGFIPYGLQEGDALLRVVRASRLMREVGVDTEWIVRVSEPKKLHFSGELLPPDEYKKRLIENLLARAALSGADISNPDQGQEPIASYSPEEIAAIARALKGMDFFVTLRAVSTPYRIADFIKTDGGDTSLDFGVILKTLETYNYVSRLRREDFDLLELPQQIQLYEDAARPRQNINFYFQEVLPKLVGLNLARMHDTGLAHVFPTASNITALGGLVDLDSVRGTNLILGDEEIGSDEMTYDLKYIVSQTTIKELYTMLSKFDKPANEDLPPMEETNNFNHNLDNFINNLTETYFHARDFGKCDQEKQKQLLEILLSLADEEEWRSAKRYLEDASFPYVGQLVDDIAEELCDPTLTITANDFARRLYMTNIFERGKSFVEAEAEVGLLPEDRPPTHEELKEALKEYLGGNFPGVEIVSDEIMEHDVKPFLVGLRYDYMSDYFDDVKARMREALAGTPFEESDDGDIILLFILHSMNTVENNMYNFNMPNPDKVWDLMARAFREIELEEKFGDKPEVAQIMIYFKNSNLVK